MGSFVCEGLLCLVWFGGGGCLGFFWRGGWFGLSLDLDSKPSLADLSRVLLLEAPNLSSHLSSLLLTLSGQIQQILFFLTFLCACEKYRIPSYRKNTRDLIIQLHSQTWSTSWTCIVQRSHNHKFLKIIFIFLIQEQSINRHYQA